MLRVYEKGMQLGGQWHPWVRWEVELHNKDRIIPWEVLLELGRFCVGCYPNALAWAQFEMSKIRTLQKQSKISYDHLIAYAAVAYGPLLNVMMEVKGSADAVLKKLHRAGTLRRLIHPFHRQTERLHRKADSGGRSMSTFLSSQDISELTGRKTKSKQIEALLRMGLPFWVNAIGRPAVTVTAIEGRREPPPEKAWSPQRKKRG